MSVREFARVQGFQDGFVFRGSVKAQYKPRLQAVFCGKSRVFAGSQSEILGSQSVQHAVFSCAARYRATVRLHAALTVAVWEFWPDWPPAKTPFLSQSLDPRYKLIGNSVSPCLATALGDALRAALFDAG